jgi:hypothetical protein
MPLTALHLETGLIDQIAPHNTEVFYRLLTEADERLLNAGRWAWTRAVLNLSVTDGMLVIPVTYRGICGCKVGSTASGVLWQEIEYLPEGPGPMPVQGCQGAAFIDAGYQNIAGTQVRVYTTSHADLTEVVVLARHEPLVITKPSDVPRCQSYSALKLGMMAILYENANDIERAQGYLSMAFETLDKQEEAYRGTAKQIFTPAQFQPLRRRSRSNFP